MFNDWKFFIINHITYITNIPTFWGLLFLKFFYTLLTLPTLLTFRGCVYWLNVFIINHITYITNIPTFWGVFFLIWKLFTIYIEKQTHYCQICRSTLLHSRHSIHSQHSKNPFCPISSHIYWRLSTGSMGATGGLEVVHIGPHSPKGS